MCNVGGLQRGAEEGTIANCHKARAKKGALVVFITVCVQSTEEVGWTQGAGVSN